MSKKISVLDLANMKEDEMPRKIKYRDGIYDYQENEKKYKKEDSEAEVWLDWETEVEILEDNTEEQENLGESWKEVGKRVGEWAKEFEQGFKESFTEIVRYPFEKLEDNTEEIKEIKGWGLATDYKDFETINHTLDRFENKINELVKAVKEIRKDLNK